MADQNQSTSKANVLTNWLKMLTGKPLIQEVKTPAGTNTTTQNTESQFPSNQSVSSTTQANTVPPTNTPTDSQNTQDNVGGENSFVADFDKLKSFTHKLSTTVGEKTAPVIQKGKAESAVIGSSASKVIDTSFIRKIVKILVIILAVMLIIFVGQRLFGKANLNIPGTVTDTTTTPGNNATATPIDIHQFTDSIYAKDPEVLKIEENIKVLDGELSNTEFKDPSLNPPNLDFDISF